jgi:hypothetical protein
MNTNTTATMKTVADLIAHVVSECSPVDIEARFVESLDYDGPVTVAGIEFYPSRILKEMDPIAFNVYMGDYADGEDVVEIGDSYYDSDAVEAAREEFLDEMRSELSDMESELSDLHDKDDLDEEADIDRRDELTLEIPAMESRIAELEHYTF